jgi:putative two-component system response regulator
MVILVVDAIVKWWKLMKQILIIDDSMISLKEIHLQLIDDYHVILAKSGMQGLQIAINERPDLILLDVEMPDMNGFDTMTRIKADPVACRIPVIFLTASDDVGTEVKALNSGAMEFIVKPVEKSILLHRIELHLRYSEYQQYLENTVKDLEDSIIKSFSDIIERRDENTGGHIIRTSQFVNLIGKELIRKKTFQGELTADYLDMMTRAAPLHDVGKIGISDIILLKPGMLDDEEFAIMKKHTTIGADILRDMYNRTPTQHYLKTAIQIAEGHHERFDGKGYPFGKKGCEIPLCARIMAVADVYDALINTRSYKAPMGHDDASRIIYSGLGSQFDPAVIEAFQSINESLSRFAQGNR